MPLANDVVVMESGVGAMVIENCRPCDWPELSLTSAVKVEVPGVVGVPLIVPFAASDKPAGSAPDAIDQV